MSDLVQTLRDMVYPCCEEAADEITRLRAALRALHDEMDEYQRINKLSAYNNQVMRQARAALGEKP